MSFFVYGVNVPVISTLSSLRRVRHMSVSVPKRIMVAIDGSEPSLKAVRYASKLAKLNGSRLTALSVVLLPAFASPRTLETLRSESSNREGEISEKTKAIAQAENVDCETKIVETTHSVVEKIIEISERENADLIVV